MRVLNLLAMAVATVCATRYWQADVGVTVYFFEMLAGVFVAVFLLLLPTGAVRLRISGPLKVFLGLQWLYVTVAVLSGLVVVLVPVSPASAEQFFPETNERRIRSTLQRHGIPGPGYVMSLGTLEPRKNLAQLIRAFGRLASRRPSGDLRLVLVGALHIELQQG